MRVTLAAAVAVAVAAVVLIAQPLGSPWWTYADADATYVAGGLNLLAGERTAYLDHPGLPLQEALEASFAVTWVAQGGSRREHAQELFLDLDRTRPVFRSWAVAFYLGGAALFAFACASLLRGAGWGLAGGLLWLGAPGLAAMSIQFRPDVLLASLCLVAAWAIARAAERRTPDAYTLAAGAVGFAMTVKIHAAGLLVPLALAFLWRRPRGELGIRVPRPALTAWLAVAFVMNANNVPFRPSAEQAAMGIAVAGALLAADHCGDA